MLRTAATLADDLLGLVLPRRCGACDRPLMRAEERLCLHCLHDLPRTRWHDDPGNRVEQLFWGRVELASATAFLFFSRSGRVQRMLHQLKYRGDRPLGVQLGRLMAMDLMASVRFGTVDTLVPVPLHPRKERMRGYNQSRALAEGMLEAWPVEAPPDLLLRAKKTPSQTRRDRLARWHNVGDAFQVPRPEDLDGRHVLLIDDVITTGATLEACTVALQRAAKVKVSVLAVACA
jgi:ComF family protein